MVKQLNSSIWPIDRTLTDTTSPDQSWTGSNDNEEVLLIPQSSMTGTSPSDDLVFHPGHSLEGGVLPPAKMHSAYSTAPALEAEI